MPLTLRSTGLSSPAFANQLDYTGYEDGRPIGRMYEDKQSLPGAALVVVDHGLRRSRVWDRNAW
jgi:hypothetical protein